MVGSGLISFSDGTAYEGQVKAWKRHGQGAFTYANGDTFAGSWEADARVDGKGTMKFADGRCYCGMWQNERITGRGTMTWPEKDEYQGQWVDGKRDGRGRMRYFDGTVFDGAWAVDDMLDGHMECNYTDPPGVYNGEWARNCRNGTGTFTEEGTCYQGQWLDDAYHGDGKLEDKTGVYFGAMIGGLKEGHGHMKYKDGSLYVGNFSKGQRHGAGCLFTKDGQTDKDGMWACDQFQTAESAVAVYEP